MAGRRIEGLEPIRTPEGVTYWPWTDGHAVGYEIEIDNRAVDFLYLNPSSSSDDGQANVFAYQGPRGDPAFDHSLIHFNVPCD